MVRSVVLLVLASAALPGIAQRVRVDYDHGRNFSQYKTYRWVVLEPAQLPDVQFPSQLMRERIVGFVEEALAARHFVRVEKGGDLLVGYDMKVGAQPQFTTFTNASGPGWGWGGWGWGGLGWSSGWDSAISTTTTQIILTGTLVVNITDARQSQLVFQGESTDTISSRPEKNTRRLRRSVNKIFEWYPPNR